MQPQHQRQDPTAAYAAALQRELVRVLTGRHGLDADDIAHEVVCKFLVDAEAVMQRTPDPIVHARRTAANAGIDHWRRDGAQRGNGSRPRGAGPGNDGRQVVPDTAQQRSGLRPAVVDVADPGPAVDDMVVTRALVGGHLADIADGDRELLVLHLGFGVPIGDLAARRSLTRETVGRRIRRALGHIAESVETSGKEVA